MVASTDRLWASSAVDHVEAKNCNHVYFTRSTTLALLCWRVCPRLFELFTEPLLDETDKGSHFSFGWRVVETLLSLKKVSRVGYAQVPLLPFSY
jgi:hypothetical protein